MFDLLTVEELAHPKMRDIFNELGLNFDSIVKPDQPLFIDFMSKSVYYINNELAATFTTHADIAAMRTAILAVTSDLFKN